MNILLVYPKYPDTFWSFRDALKFISKKAVNPPLGLITVSSILPESWHKKLVDMNIESLCKKDILWADYIFISAMNVQQESTLETIHRCKSLNKKIVGGGPLFTEQPEMFSMVDHLVLNEAELTLPEFLNDLAKGIPKRVYQSDAYAQLTDTPLPDNSLVKISKYNTMNIQFTRGCPFNCDFCDITALLGHEVRMKSTQQIINELEALYDIGWRNNVFFVDDNFIGNRKVLKSDLLPAVINWMEKRNYPFIFSTEASINLSDDNELMELMTRAGFSTVFIGIETTEVASLAECGKIQNINRDLIQSVHRIQENGLEVTGGFILGFDNDSPSIFQKQIYFIRERGIITAMVGLLNAPKKTRLYKRLKQEGRIINEFSGSNTDFSLNFIPKMDREELIEGYKNVIKGIYGGKEYYKRVTDYLRRINPDKHIRMKLSLNHLMAFFRSFVKLGIFDVYRKQYWKLLFWTLFTQPRLVPLAITYSVYGFHFRKVFKDVI